MLSSLWLWLWMSSSRMRFNASRRSAGSSYTLSRSWARATTNRLMFLLNNCNNETKLFDKQTILAVFCFFKSIPPSIQLWHIMSMDNYKVALTCCALDSDRWVWRCTAFASFLMGFRSGASKPYMAIWKMEIFGTSHTQKACFVPFELQWAQR